MPDDIPFETTTSESANEGQRPIPPKDGGSRRTVGPESEVRGGPEAADDSLNDTKRQPDRR